MKHKSPNHARRSRPASFLTSPGRGCRCWREADNPLDLSLRHAGNDNSTSRSEDGGNQMRFVRLLIVAMLVPAYAAAHPTVALAQSAAKIVGLGGARCSEFLKEAKADPSIQRDYLAWAQGYMSGILITRPSGVDETLDLLPPGFPPPRQFAFLVEQCAVAPAQSFSDAVEALYKHLRSVGQNRT